MIDVRQIDDKYHVGREKPGGKVYIKGPNESTIAAYSGLTKTMEWYQTITPEEKTLIEAYVRENY